MFSKSEALIIKIFAVANFFPFWLFLFFRQIVRNYNPSAKYYGKRLKLGLTVVHVTD